MKLCTLHQTLGQVCCQQHKSHTHHTCIRATIKPNLLLSTTNSVKHKPPRELVNMLSCFDGRFSALTKDCKDTDDVIAVLIDNVTYLDYDLPQYVAEATKDEALAADTKNYMYQLERYLRRKITHDYDYPFSNFTIDKEMCIHPDDTRTISQFKKYPFKRSQYIPSKSYNIRTCVHNLIIITQDTLKKPTEQKCTTYKHACMHA